MAELFDLRLRALRRDRACRQGPQTFLLERAFDDVLERLSFVRREFRSALLVGCPDPRWRDKLSAVAAAVDVVDPGPLFAARGGGRCVVEEEMNLDVGAHDLCVAIGTLDTVNDLPQALLRVRLALQEGALFVGALAGGDSLPRLRAAMRAADERLGAASPHVHPRIEPGALAGLLSAAGFVDPVVDVDRVQVAYASLADLVRDLRAMGATNVLSARSKRPLPREAAAAAAAAFAPAAGENKAVERFDILHFAAWTPAGPADG
jgi:NADH dehydrogenase [ubiquinone] 1 alpha subcomplex assembly factor 5